MPWFFFLDQMRQRKSLFLFQKMGTGLGRIREQWQYSLEVDREEGVVL